MDRDTFVASITQLQRDADLVAYAEEVLVVDERGNVARIVEVERNEEGGTIEWRTIAVTAVCEGLISRIEYFAADDVEAALARFDLLASLDAVEPSPSDDGEASAAR